MNSASDRLFCSVKDTFDFIFDMIIKDILILTKLIKHKNILIKPQKKAIKSITEQIIYLTKLELPCENIDKVNHELFLTMK